MFRLIALTLVTYFLMSSNSRFQDISEVFSSHELALMGLASLLYLIFIRNLNPITSISTEEIFTIPRLEKKFLPGLLQGSALSLGIALAFILSGLYRYWGFIIQPEEAAFSLANVLLRIASLVCLAYCEEFIFRHKVLNYLRRQIPDLYAILLTAILYTGIKILQFDLSFMQITTLFLVAFALGIRARNESDFAHGAGFWAGMLVVLHPLLSLPVMGNDFSGVLLVKYEIAAEADSALYRFLTGGAGGPLSSFAVQLLLIFYTGRRILRLE